MKTVRMVLVAFLVLILFTGCAPEERNYYTGTVESERFSVMTSLSGQIVEILVKEGDTVSSGDVIATLKTDKLEIEVERLNANLNAAQADLERILKGAREEEVNQIRQQIEQQKDQIAILQDQLNYAFDNHETIETLYQSGAAPKKQLDDAKLAKDNAVSMRDQAKSQKAFLVEQLNLVLGGATEEEVAAAQSRVEMVKWSIESVKESMKDAVLYANVDGAVERINYKVGEQYKMMTNFAEISDVSNLKVRIYVAEMNMHQANINDIVAIKVDYDPSVTLDGTIEYIASDGEFTPKNLESRENRQEVVYETRINLGSGDGKLKPGMLVDVYLEDTEPGDDVNE